MSGPFAAAAVSAVLRRLLSSELGSLAAFGSVSVTALPPDRVNMTPNEPSQLNLFMYQALANAGWRNAGLPSHGQSGERLTNPPLGLNLHYMLTAYGAEEWFAEALLGYGMQVLHETPVLSRNYIRETWTGGGLTPAEQALADSNLADQIELIKITPLNLNVDELSKLWTAIQAKYRPTAAYQVSVVLIEGARPARTPLPVLRQGPDDHGPAAVAPPFPTFPSLTRVHPAGSEQLPAVRLGDDLVILGDQLDDASAVRVIHVRLQNPFDLPPGPGRTSRQMTLHIPTAPDDPNALSAWVCGFYSLQLVAPRPGLPQWTTNAVSFALAPTLTVRRPPGASAPLAVAAGDVVTLTCAPRIRAQQEGTVDLMLGMQPVQVATITTPPDTAQPTTLTFTVPTLPAGDYLVRLRVDGVDSLPILVSGTPPIFAFDDAQKVRIA